MNEEKHTGIQEHRGKKERLRRCIKIEIYKNQEKKRQDQTRDRGNKRREEEM